MPHDDLKEVPTSNPVIQKRVFAAYMSTYDCVQQGSGQLWPLTGSARRADPLTTWRPAGPRRQGCILQEGAEVKCSQESQKSGMIHL